MTNIVKANQIAVKSLRRGYKEEGIVAGAHHYTDYWARDSFYASLGALALGDYEIVKKNLNLYLSYQRDDGQLPMKVGDSRLLCLLRILGFRIRGKRVPAYSEDKARTIPMDQNSLLVICFYNYIKETSDMPFLRENIHRIEQCIQWSLAQDRDNDLILEEGLQASWTDSLKKRGKVLYSNICHCHALYCISKLFELLKEGEKQNIYLDLYKKTKQQINKLFWNGSYFIDWIDEKRHDYFSTDGNVLSMVWNIADQEQSKNIQHCIKKFGINKFVPSLTNMPKYPSNLCSLLLRIGGLKDYHNGLCWLWLGCLDAVAKYKTGMQEEAAALLERIADIIVKYDDVFEVYEKSGRPVHRLLYKSEYHFAESSGLFIWAYREIKT